MSVCEDKELKDLVMEALERSGQLATVRAHLRASILGALEGELPPLAPPGPPRLALWLTLEMMEHCQLKRSALVLKAEAGRGQPTYPGRAALLEHFPALHPIASDSQGDIPLLQLLLQHHDASLANANSEHYDLSFVSEPDTSQSSVEVNTVPTEQSQDVQDPQPEDNTTTVESQSNSISEILVKDDLDNSNITDHKSSSSHSTYGKYLQEKHNKSNSTIQKKLPDDLKLTEPVDIMMKHVIQSRIKERDIKNEESLSEELQQMTEKSTVSETSRSIDEITEDISEISNTTTSINKNILDETLPESPETKQKVVESINNLKMQSLRITHDDKIVLEDSGHLKNTNIKKSVIVDTKDFLKSNVTNKGVNLPISKSGTNNSSTKEKVEDIPVIKSGDKNITKW